MLLALKGRGLLSNVEKHVNAHFSGAARRAVSVVRHRLGRRPSRSGEMNECTNVSLVSLGTIEGRRAVIPFAAALAIACCGDKPGCTPTDSVCNPPPDNPRFEQVALSAPTSVMESQPYSASLTFQAVDGAIADSVVFTRGSDRIRDIAAPYTATFTAGLGAGPEKIDAVLYGRGNNAPAHASATIMRTALPNPRFEALTLTAPPSVQEDQSYAVTLAFEARDGAVADSAVFTRGSTRVVDTSAPYAASLTAGVGAGVEHVHAVVYGHSGFVTANTSASVNRTEAPKMAVELDMYLFSLAGGNNEVNNTGSVRLRNTATGKDTTLHGVNGQIRASVRRGPYELRIDDADNSELHRLQAANLNNVSGYAITDYDDRPILISERESLSGRIETVKSAQILADMATQWTANPATARVGEVIFAFYRGNPTCKYVVNVGTQCSDTSIPPGLAFTAQQEADFDTFMNAVKSMYMNSIIGWTPFDIKVEKFGPENYQPHITVWGPEISTPTNRRQLVFGKEFSHTEGSSIISEHGVNVVARAAMGVGGSTHHVNFYSSEMRIFGPRTESDPPICSVKDREQVQLPNCRKYNSTYIFYPKDQEFNAIVGAYIASAQVQQSLTQQPSGFNPRIIPR